MTLICRLDFGGAEQKGPAAAANVDFPTIISAQPWPTCRQGWRRRLPERAGVLIAQGFQDYAREQIEAGGSTDFATWPRPISPSQVMEQLRAAVSSDQVVDSQKLAANLTKALGDDQPWPRSAPTCHRGHERLAQIAAQLGTTLTKGGERRHRRSMQEAMTAMTSMMTQLSTTIGNQIGATMEQLPVSSAFSARTRQAFADTPLAWTKRGPRGPHGDHVFPRSATWRRT